jgi:hypothetical protein
LVDKVKSIDDSRPVLSAVCGFWNVTRESDPEEYRNEFLSKYKNSQTDLKEWSRCTAPFMEPLDIVGYNYWYDRYELDSKEYPERVIMGTETHAINFYKSWKELTVSSHKCTVKRVGLSCQRHTQMLSIKYLIKYTVYFTDTFLCLVTNLVV